MLAGRLLNAGKLGNRLGYPRGKSRPSLLRHDKPLGLSHYHTSLHRLFLPFSSHLTISLFPSEKKQENRNRLGFVSCHFFVPLGHTSQVTHHNVPPARFKSAEDAMADVKGRGAGGGHGEGIQRCGGSEVVHGVETIMCRQGCSFGRYWRRCVQRLQWLARLN